MIKPHCSTETLDAEPDVIRLIHDGSGLDEYEAERIDDVISRYFTHTHALY